MPSVFALHTLPLLLAYGRVSVNGSRTRGLLEPSDEKSKHQCSRAMQSSLALTHSIRKSYNCYCDRRLTSLASRKRSDLLRSQLQCSKVWSWRAHPRLVAELSASAILSNQQQRSHSGQLSSICATRRHCSKTSWAPHVIA
jgi:hypothetical protein